MKHLSPKVKRLGLCQKNDYLSENERYESEWKNQKISKRLAALGALGRLILFPEHSAYCGSAACFQPCKGFCNWNKVGKEMVSQASVPGCTLHLCSF